MMELNYFNRCLFCFDGKEALDCAVKVIKTALAAHKSKNVEYIKPISIMMLDF